MPTDVRKLIFSKQELRVAFQNFCQAKGLSVPNSPLETFQVVESSAGRVVSEHAPEGMKIILYFTSHDPSNPLRVQLTEDEALEAMITLCKQQSIPLPRRGQKFLQKHKDGLALTMGMTQNDLRIAHEG
jgi:hypothetical protein